jgi:hypothetical protein
MRNRSPYCEWHLFIQNMGVFQPGGHSLSDKEENWCLSADLPLPNTTKLSLGMQMNNFPTFVNTPSKHLHLDLVSEKIMPPLAGGFR